MTKLYLVNAAVRARAINEISAAPDGYTVKIEPPKKSRGQEEKYHAQIGDIHKSKAFRFLGRNDWQEEDIKRLLVDAFAAEKASMGEPLQQVGRVVPSIDGLRTVQLGIQTRLFIKKEASDFVEYLYAYGAQIGVEFLDRPAMEAA
jgi:hypothetical protein